MPRAEDQGVENTIEPTLGLKLFAEFLGTFGLSYSNFAWDWKPNAFIEQLPWPPPPAETQASPLSPSRFALQHTLSSWFTESEA